MSTSVVENHRMSPMTTRQSFPIKTISQEKIDPTAFKVDISKSPGIAITHTVTERYPVLRKNSQSESALDQVFQQAQQAETESAHEENVSTDSSLPSNDDDRKLKKKRFQFPSLVKRIKNKT